MNTKKDKSLLYAHLNIAINNKVTIVQINLVLRFFNQSEPIN